MTTKDSIEEMRRLLQARLQEWHLREEQPQYRSKPVVAITEEPGCRGAAIAERLCAELDFHLYNWELVEQIAKDADVSTRLVSSLEEHPRSELEDWLTELEGDVNLTSQAYVGSLKKVLFAIAVHGNAVIMGRGSNFFLPPDKKIGLCFVAPLDLRIKNTMEELGLSENDARKHISNVEKKHQQLIKKYFHADIRDPIHYHLVVNTALVKPEVIVEMVKITHFAAWHDICH
jgi:cytidylate kinase